MHFGQCVFKVCPKRWIEERAFAWLNCSRRLFMDCGVALLLMRARTIQRF